MKSIFLLGNNKLFQHVKRFRILPVLALAFFIAFAPAISGCGKRPVSSTKPIVAGKATGQGIVSTARKTVGVKYKYGGNTPSSGFDCSGLVCWTYAQHGIKVPRTTTEQRKMGQTVSKSQLKPGDVVVFKAANRNGLHTGIYTGKGKFIHSPSTGKRVQEESIDSKYWKPRFVTARRLPQVR